MSRVLPGVAEVMANPLWLVSILMREDFPTLLRPMKAYSGRLPSGHFRTSVLLMTNFALLMCMFRMNEGLINSGEPQSCEGQPTIDHKHFIAERITCVLLGEIVQRKAKQGRGYADIGHKAVDRVTLREQSKCEEA